MSAGRSTSCVRDVNRRIHTALGELERGHLTETSGRAPAEGASLDDYLERGHEGVLLVHGPSFLSDAAKDSAGGAGDAWTRLVEQLCANRGRSLLVLSDTAKAMARVLAVTPALAGQLRLFEFDDYSAVELGRVLESMAKANHYRFSHEARLEILGCLDYVVTRDGALPGNAVRLRELFEQAVSRQARRVAEAPGCSPAQLTAIQAGDFIFEMVPEEITQRRPKFILVECQCCQARGRLPAKLLGCRIQCRACRHEMLADRGLPSPPHA